jgi:DNA-binding beta-propeller fold protein YncE
MMAFLHRRIDHVIYIVKANKTYDQVLGDLPRGNGDPTLTEFPQAVSPNHRSLALTFGLLDNFYDSGQVSGDGWAWSTYGQTTDYNEKTIAVHYGNGPDGVTYDTEGTNRLIGIGLPDQNNADTFLYNEWVRDVAVNGIPNLTLLRLPHDHFGSFSTAIAGLNMPSLQMSDNDFAIGQVVDFISHSQFWQNTAIFILEDDAQEGDDHVDAHRSIGYAISPYSRRGVTISTNYNTVNVLRTIEDILGIDHLNQSDANAAPMADAFTRVPNFTPYSAIIPGSLCAAPVDPNLVPACKQAGARLPPNRRATRFSLVGCEGKRL